MKSPCCRQTSQIPHHAVSSPKQPQFLLWMLSSVNVTVGLLAWAMAIIVRADFTPSGKRRFYFLGKSSYFESELERYLATRMTRKNVPYVDHRARRPHWLWQKKAMSEHVRCFWYWKGMVWNLVGLPAASWFHFRGQSKMYLILWVRAQNVLSVMVKWTQSNTCNVAFVLLLKVKTNEFAW